MSIRSLINSASGVATKIPAEGVDFDGTNDYLSRSSDLVGNVDSKTFTFSAFIWFFDSNNEAIYTVNNGTYDYVRITNYGDQFGIRMFNSAGTQILYARCNSGTVDKTFINIIISVDLTNTSNRSIYINDYSQSVTWTTYVNDNINFTESNHIIGTSNYQTPNVIAADGKLKGRLSNIFLSYDYIDLSIAENRRIFINEDGTAVSELLSRLSARWFNAPILYLPMRDSATCHVNEGTGGNFVLNGTVATSNVGANQQTCRASYFDGAADYLSRTSFIPQSDRFTFSCSMKHGVLNGNNLYCMQIGGSEFAVFHQSSIDRIAVQCYSTGNVLRGMMSIETGKIPENVTIVLQVSWVLGGAYRVVLNGKNVTPSVTTNVAGNVKFDQTVRIASDDAITLTNGNIGELYFDTKYIDLSTNNPFWDSVANKPKPVRQVIRETGVTPLIAMPLDASNAGKNYGTGGDFTANSGPYVGARGASEWWQRTAKFDGSTSYLSSTGLTGITDSKTLTMVAHVYKTASTLYHIVGSTNSNVSISINASNQLIITAKNSAGTTILSATVTTTIANTAWTSILVSIDLNNTANRSVYLNGVLASVTWATYTNDLIDFTNASWIVGADVALGNKYNGTLSLMLDNTYVDFTSETNRLKYIDGLSYPISINNQVLEGKITKPALYLAFEDTANLGLNSGYGGNLNVNGTLVAGADVLG